VGQFPRPRAGSEEPDAKKTKRPAEAGLSGDGGGGDTQIVRCDTRSARISQFLPIAVPPEVPPSH